MRNQKLDLKALVLFAVCTAIPCVLRTLTLTVPIQPVPRTMASVGACLAGGTLGPKKGGLTQLLYLLLVLVGFPFTPNFKSGVAAFLSPHGGYLFGYVLMAVVTGYCYRLFNSYFDWLFITEKRLLILFTKWLNIVVAGVIGTIALHIVGLSYFMMVTGYSLQQTIDCGYGPFIAVNFLTILISAKFVLMADKQVYDNWWWVL